MAYKQTKGKAGLTSFRDEGGNEIHVGTPKVGGIYRFGDPTGRGGYEPWYFTVDPQSGKYVNIGDPYARGFTGNFPTYKGQQLKRSGTIPSAFKSSFESKFANRADYEGIDPNKSSAYMQAATYGEEPVAGRIDTQGRNVDAQGRPILPMQQAGTRTEGAPDGRIVRLTATQPAMKRSFPGLTELQVRQLDDAYARVQNNTSVGDQDQKNIAFAERTHAYTPPKQPSEVLGGGPSDRLREASVKATDPDWMAGLDEARLRAEQGRANPDDLANLQYAADRYGYDYTPEGGPPSDLTPDVTQGLIGLSQDIDAIEGLSLEQKAILKEIAGMDFTSGQKIHSVEELRTIIDDAAKMAEANLSPYFEKVSGRTLEDLKNKMADIRTGAARFAQQESLDYKQRLAQTKQSLRTRGLTFSGESTRLMGTEGFKESPREGEIQEERRKDWEDVRAGWQESARDIGTEAERYLGSARLGKYGTLPSPYQTAEGLGTTYRASGTSPLYSPKQMGSTGYIERGKSDLGLEKKKAIEQQKWQNIKAYRPFI